MSARKSLDLLRKSGLDRNAIAECSNEIDPEVKTAPSVAVGFLEDAEDLEPPDDMLHGESHPRQSTIVSPLGVIRIPNISRNI